MMFSLRRRRCPPHWPDWRNIQARSKSVGPTIAPRRGNASRDGAVVKGDSGGSAVTAIPVRITAAVAGALLLASCQQASEPLPPVSGAPEAQATLEEYLRKVDGRFGALALS